MSEYPIFDVSKEDLQKIAVVGAHLHKWQGEGDEGIRKVFQEQGMIQLDPLNPAGRNHDLFLSSRISNYKYSRFQQIAYPERIVFESYFPNLMAIYAEHFPLFVPQMKKEFLHKYYQARIEKIEKIHEGLLDEARDFLVKNGPSKAADLEELASKKPDFTFWKTSNLAGMALEMLWLLGKVMICERDQNWRKIYGLVEDYFDKSLLVESKLSDEEISFQKFLVTQKSYPLVNLGKVSISKQGKLVLGKRKRLSPEWFNTLENDISPHILRIDGAPNGFAVPANWKDFLLENLDKEMRAIAPLDPLIWDRELTWKIFDFEYVWEVYKVAKDRKWGYYVYPLLFEGKFIGRLEANLDKKKKVLRFFNLQLEENYDMDNRTESALHNLFERWKTMLEADEIDLDKLVK